MSCDYDDILLLPHPTSARHPRMAARARAAQFAPFAALTGYEAAVQETARLTCERLELDEYLVSTLSDRLQIVAEHLAQQPEITFTYFQPDQTKSGGAYCTRAGIPQKIDSNRRLVLLADGMMIPFDELIAIEGLLFQVCNDL